MWLTEARGRAFCVALMVWVLTLGHAAFAQTDEQRAAARSLATEGATAFNEGRYQDAIDLFTRAETLVHAPPHLLFLARSYVKLGRFVKARETYMRVVKETLPANASPAFRDAQARANDELALVEPRIAFLTVTVEGGEGKSDVAVLVDGSPLASVLIGAARPIDPGEHKVEAGASEFRAPEQTITLGEGERKSLVMRLEPAPGAPPLVAVAQAPGPPSSEPQPFPSNQPAVSPAPAEATDPGAAESSDGKTGLRIGSYVAFGVGVVGLAAGTLFTLQSSSKRSDADQKFEECGGPTGCFESNPLAKEADDLDRDADSALTLGIVGFAVGGVGIAAGTTLLILSSGGASEKAAGVRPYVGLGVAGVQGRF